MENHEVFDDVNAIYLAMIHNLSVENLSPEEIDTILDDMDDEEYDV